MKPLVESEIAWELVDYLSPYLSADERNLTFVDLGSADYLIAIHRLLDIARCNQFAIPPTMLERLWLWTRLSRREQEFAPTLARIRKSVPR